MNESTVNSASGDSREVLVIAIGVQAANLFERLPGSCRVQQTVSERVATVECRSSDLSKLASTPGVTIVTDAEPPPAVMDGLDQGEAIFVAAWLLRRDEEKQPKKRAGDGLSWDAPGFLPPDKPSNS